MAEPVEAAHLRRAAGLDELIAACEPALAKVADRLCASPADARDLVQDTIERVMRQGVPADVRNPRAWLATVMHNLFIDRCRATARQPAHESFDESHAGVTSIDEAEEPAWGRATIEDVRAALDQIDPTFAQVYKLHTFDRLSYEEIASRLRIERVTVGTRLNRARKKLRDVLVQRLGLEETP